MFRKIVIVNILVLFFISREAFSDTLYLKNGNKINGIITKETPSSIDVKINIGATVTFSRQDIQRIEKDSFDTHAKMEKAWQEEKSLKEKESASASGRKAKIVEYEDKSITTEEKERMQAANIVKEAEGGTGEERVSYKKYENRSSAVAKKLLKKGNWFLKETENFSIFYRDASQSKLISDKAEYYFEKIAYDLGYEGEIKWKERCRVYIIETVDKWKEFLLEIGIDHELVGGFVPNYEGKEMYLCALSDVYLAVTFPHELTHLIFREIAGNSTIPLWLNEGLANYEASITSVSNELLTNYIKQGKHILLGDLLRMTNYPEGKNIRELFYAQSEKLVEFLITQYGRKKFRGFCELILKDNSFREALFGAYKNDFKDIEDFNIKLVEYIVK